MRNIVKAGTAAMALTGMLTATPQIVTTSHAQSVSIDGQYMRSNVAPIKRNGRTLVAMRPIFEGLGANVQWDGANQRITAQTDNTEVVMQIGNSVAIVNGQAVLLDQAPMLYRGNTMVPLRFVSEAMGAQVNYDARANNIGIATQQGTPTNAPAQLSSETSVANQPITRSGVVSLSIAKQLYAPNEPIELSFTAPTSLSSSTRGDLIPGDTPPNNPTIDKAQRLTHAYLGGKARGTLQYKAPTKAGKYLLRVNDDKTQYTSVSIEVQPITPDATPQIAIEKDAFVPGEPIAVHFEAFPFYSSSARVDIVPSDIPAGSSELNKKNRLSHQYLGGKTQGILEFTAPSKLGHYDFRMDDNYGHQIALISFSVEPTTTEVTPTLAIDRNEFREGDTISVSFEAFPFYSSSAWIGIVPADVEHGSEEINKINRTTHQYTGRKLRGVVELKAPKAGVYDIRFNDNYGNEIASTAEFTVYDKDGNSGKKRTQTPNNAGTGSRNNRVEDIADDVADDAASAATQSLKDKIRKRIFR